MSRPTDGEPRDASSAWLARTDGSPTPGESLEEPEALRVRRVLRWVQVAFVLGSATVLLMFAAVALVLTHATTATRPATPSGPPPLRIVPFTDVDWPGYAPGAPLTGDAPTHGDLLVYREVAERLIRDPDAAPLGYTVGAALDDTGALDFDRDPHGTVAFDYLLSTGGCARATIGRGHTEWTQAIACEGEPLSFPPPDLAAVMALARATCPVIFEHGARPLISVRHASRWMRLEVHDPSLPDLSFSAVAARDGTLHGAICATR